MGQPRRYRTDLLTQEQTGITGFTTAQPLPNGTVVELLGTLYLATHSFAPAGGATTRLTRYVPPTVLTVAHEVQPTAPADLTTIDFTQPV